MPGQAGPQLPAPPGPPFPMALGSSCTGDMRQLLQLGQKNWVVLGGGSCQDLALGCQGTPSPHWDAAPQCRLMLAQVGMCSLTDRLVIWSTSEFWEHLLSWIITCPVSCIPCMLPN